MLLKYFNLNNLALEWRYLFFVIGNLLHYKLFPSTKRRGKVLKILTLLLSIVIALLSAVFMIFLMLIYLIPIILVGVAIFAIITFFRDIELATLVSLIVAGVGAVIYVIKDLLSPRKQFSEKRKEIYINLTSFFIEEISHIKEGKKISNIPNLAEVNMYSSNIVLKLLSKIKELSCDLVKIEQKRKLVYYIMFILDYMRYEVKSRVDVVFSSYNHTEFQILCDGELDRDEEYKNNSSEKTDITVN